MLALFALPSAWSPQVDGRAVASRRSAISLGAALFAPVPAFAKSKEKAKVVRKKVACKEKGLLKMIVHIILGCLPRVRTPLCGQCDEEASRET